MTAPSLDPLDAAIAARRAQDPLVGAKLGAEDLSRRLLQAMAGEQGVQIESFLAVCGALAGYACQASLWARAAAAGALEPSGLQSIGTADGRTFLVGEPLVELLFNEPHALWRLAAGAAQQAGCTDLPDPAALWRHGMESLGSEAFGVPRVPSRHQPAPDSLQALPTLWPAVQPLVQRYCADPLEWPVLYGLLSQKAIGMGREVIDPCLALGIVMDTAIAHAMVILPPGQDPAAPSR